MFKINETEVVFDFPENVKSIIDNLWNELSEEKQDQLRKYYNDFVPHAAEFSKILKMLKSNWDGIALSRRKIAIVGPANVGKSSLYNLFIINKDDKAEVGPIPGVTRENQESENLLFNIIDTPGADAVGEVGIKERQIAFHGVKNADFLIIMYEATRGIRVPELELFTNIMEIIEKKPFIVVCNKMDLIRDRKNKEKIIKSMATNIGIKSNQLIPMSAQTGLNFDKLILGITKFEPAFLNAIGQVLPQYQTKLTWHRIMMGATSCGAIALAPIPFATMIPLVTIQGGMVASIAKIYGVNFDARLAKEATALFGAGILARGLYRNLIVLGGLPGWILSSSIAISSTIAIGLASKQWFEFGEKPTRQWVNNRAKELAVIVKDSIVSLWKEKPTSENFRERMDDLLNVIRQRIFTDSDG
jgi:small GTP-binding protein